MANENFPFPHDADRDIFREALAHSEAITCPGNTSGALSIGRR